MPNFRKLQEESKNGYLHYWTGLQDPCVFAVPNPHAVVSITCHFSLLCPHSCQDIIPPNNTMTQHFSYMRASNVEDKSIYFLRDKKRFLSQNGSITKVSEYYPNLFLKENILSIFSFRTLIGKYQCQNCCLTAVKRQYGVR